MKYRVKFSKEGPIKYIGHLDVMRYFQKAIRRAEIPIAYTEGFSPHQILSFAFPLSVGYTSIGEYFDMELDNEFATEEIKSRLNSVMNEGIKILDVRKLPKDTLNCMASVFAAKYEVTLKDDSLLPENYQNRFIDYFSQMTIPVNKPKKKGGGYLPINLKEFIYDFGVEDKAFTFTVNASSSGNIRPLFVMECFLNSMNINSEEIKMNVKRIDILGNKTNENKIDLISLMDV